MRWIYALPRLQQLVPYCSNAAVAQCQSSPSPSSSSSSPPSFRLKGPDEPIAPPPCAKKSRIIFIGTGNSTGIPLPQCLLGLREHPDCRVSLLAARGSPDRNRNYRGNPALLVQHRDTDGELTNIQIDVGKTFKESVLRWYPRFGVSHLDCVIITHAHADAILGMDDLRTVQRLPKLENIHAIVNSVDNIPPMPVWVNTRHVSVVQTMFPYLFLTESQKSAVARFTAKLDLKKFEDCEVFHAPSGLAFTSLPVYHGKDYLSQGFLFGKGDRVAYLSDVTEVPEATMKVLEEKPIDLLVADTLLLDTPHPSHFSLEQAVDLARKLRPKKTLLVGMSAGLEHHEVNEHLRALLEEEGLDVQLAYDGQWLDLDL